MAAANVKKKYCICLALRWFDHLLSAVGNVWDYTTFIFTSFWWLHPNFFGMWFWHQPLDEQASFIKSSKLSTFYNFCLRLNIYVWDFADYHVVFSFTLHTPSPRHTPSASEDIPWHTHTFHNDMVDGQYAVTSYMTSCSALTHTSVEHWANIDSA